MNVEKLKAVREFLYEFSTDQQWVEQVMLGPVKNGQWSPAQIMLGLDDFRSFVAHETLENVTQYRWPSWKHWSCVYVSEKSTRTSKRTRTRKRKRGSDGSSNCVPTAHTDWIFDPLKVLQPEGGGPAPKVLKCVNKKCGSFNTRFLVVQKRKGDEGYSLDCVCKQCGHQWHVK